MVMPALLNFVISAPTAHVADHSATWLQICLQAESSHIILLNDRHHPVGTVHLPRLVATDHAAPAEATPVAAISLDAPDPHADTALTAVSANLIDGVSVVASNLSIEAAIETISGATEQLWVVVNHQHHYLGVLDTARLFDFAWQQQRLASPRQDASLSVPAARSRVNPYSTVLVTHLGHELKTPLTSLLGLSSLLKTQKIGRLTPRQNHYVSLIQQHARRLTAQVNAVLDLGRINSGTLQIMPQVVAIADFCQDAYRQARLLIGETSADPKSEPLMPETALPTLTLVVDPLRLGQMLTYLIYLTLRQSPNPLQFPLNIEPWERWILFTPLGLQDSGRLQAYPPQLEDADHKSTDYTAAEGWLELLLTRKLAHLHRGELVMMAHPQHPPSPVLLLPLQAEAAQKQLLVLATVDPTVTEAVCVQVSSLNYRLVITLPGSDTLDVVARLGPAAVLIDGQTAHHQALIRQLRTDSRTQACPMVVLVPPAGEVPTGLRSVDHQISWPSDQLTLLLATPPAPVAPPPKRITVLYLRSAQPAVDPELTVDLPTLLHDCGCQVLEVDDLDQASLLNRVWSPDAIVLDPTIADPNVYLQGFSGFPELTQLPLVTLTSEATQVAHGFPQVNVYPCLLGECDWQVPAESNQVLVWLQEVLQVAIAQQPPF